MKRAIEESEARCVCAVDSRGHRCKNRAAAGSNMCRSHQVAGGCRDIPTVYEDSTEGLSGSARSLRTASHTLTPPPEKTRKGERAAVHSSTSHYLPDWPKSTGSDLVLNFGRIFKIEDLIGAGAYGEVLRVRDTSDGTVYAMKLEKKPRDRGRCAEAEIMKKVRAVLPEIPMVHECSYFVNKEGNMFTYMVMDIFDGDCETEIEEIRDRLRTDLARSVYRCAAEFAFVCMEMARQVDLLEKRGIYHVDIKFRNMLYRNGDATHRRTAVLTDFGIACDFSPQHACIAGGTYMPPEWKGRKGSEVRDANEIRLAQRYMVGMSIYDELTSGFVINKTARESLHTTFTAPEYIADSDINQGYRDLHDISLTLCRYDAQSRTQSDYPEIVSACRRIMAAVERATGR